MGQEFHVLRCFRCQSFQVQQVKKVNKWSCKLCGEKQSLLKEFGRGSGADCRRHVQKLNAMRGAMLEEREQDALSLWEQVEENSEELSPAPVSPTQVSPAQESPTPVSRWSKYLDPPKEESEENVSMDRQHLHNNRKRKRTDSSSTPEQVTGLMTSSPHVDQSSPRAGSVKERAGPMVTTKPRPQLPVTSMFDSGEDFDFEF